METTLDKDEIGKQHPVDSIEPEILEKWIEELQITRDKVQKCDTEPWQAYRLQSDTCEKEETEQSNCSVGCEATNSVFCAPSEMKIQALKFVAGYDISYLKNECSTACSALIICKLPDLEVVYEDLKILDIDTPYVPGFLSFREASPLFDSLKRLQEIKPELMPQVILIDGNGCLHKEGAGLACYVGVKLELPTIGIGKNLFAVENIQKDEHHIQEVNNLKNAGDSFPLTLKNGTVIGMALKTSAEAKKPVYVSVGHRISIETALWVVKSCCRYRIPEPIRQADIRSRKYLRENYGQEVT